MRLFRLLLIGSLLSIQSLFPMRTGLQRSISYARNPKLYGLTNTLAQNSLRQKIYTPLYRSFNRSFSTQRAYQSFSKNSYGHWWKNYLPKAGLLGSAAVAMHQWIFPSVNTEEIEIQRFFDSLNEEKSFQEFMQKLKQQESLQSQYAQYLANNIITMFQAYADDKVSNNALLKFIDLLCANEGHKNLIRQAIINNFHNIISIKGNSYLLYSLIKINIDMSDDFINVVLNNFEKIIANDIRGMRIIKLLIKHNQNFVSSIIKNYANWLFAIDESTDFHDKSVREQYLSRKIIERAKENQTTKEYLSQWFLNNYKKVDFNLFYAFLSLFEDCLQSEQVCKLITENEGDSLLDITHKLLCYNQLNTQCGLCNISSCLPQTVHEYHLSTMLPVLVDVPIIRDLKPFIHDPKLLLLFNKVNQTTKELKNNYYIFIHAQGIRFYALQQWYNTLRCITEEETLPTDYFYPWIVKPVKSLANENAMQEKLLKEGEYDKSLFMNHAFFGNMCSDGKDSTEYLAFNNNCYDGEETTLRWFHEIFNALGLENIYKKYEKALGQHGEKFQQLSEYGNLLFIAVPKECINQSVYSCDLGAKHQEVLINNNRTKEIKKIMEEIEHNPKLINDVMFCLVMTQSPNGGGLNPESGIKIIPFNVIDKEKLEEFEKEKAELLAMMKDDILAAREKCSH